MQKTVEEYEKLMVLEKDDIITFKEDIVVLYNDGHSKYNVIIEKIRYKKMLFSAVKEEMTNYNMQNLDIGKICDKNLISCLKNIFPDYFL